MESPAFFYIIFLSFIKEYARIFQTSGVLGSFQSQRELTVEYLRASLTLRPVLRGKRGSEGQLGTDIWNNPYF